MYSYKYVCVGVYNNMYVDTYIYMHIRIYVYTLVSFRKRALYFMFLIAEIFVFVELQRSFAFGLSFGLFPQK